MAAAPAAPIPAVYVADIALAGIGRDIYNSLSATVQGLVQWAEFAVGLIPFLGGGIRGQIDINYFGLIQPLIANTVYALSNIIADPLGILNTVGSYISNQVYVGYTWVTDQIAFFGLPPLLGPIPAPPRLASVGESATAPVAARTLGPRAAAVVMAAPVESAPVESAPVESAGPDAETTAEVDEPARSVRSPARRVAADARQSAQSTQGTPTNQSTPTNQGTPTNQSTLGTQATGGQEVPAAPAEAEAGAVTGARVPARATRGTPNRANNPSRGATEPVASASA
jgi:hypothetical protein